MDSRIIFGGEKPLFWVGSEQIWLRRLWLWCDHCGWYYRSNQSTDCKKYNIEGHVTDARWSMEICIPSWILYEFSIWILGCDLWWWFESSRDWLELKGEELEADLREKRAGSWYSGARFGWSCFRTGHRWYASKMGVQWYCRQSSFLWRFVSTWKRFTIQCIESFASWFGRRVDQCTRIGIWWLDGLCFARKSICSTKWPLVVVGLGRSRHEQSHLSSRSMVEKTELWGKWICTRLAVRSVCHEWIRWSSSCCEHRLRLVDRIFEEDSRWK